MSTTENNKNNNNLNQESSSGYLALMIKHGQVIPASKKTQKDPLYVNLTENKTEIKSETDLLSKYKLAKPYDSFNEDEKKSLFGKLDNFLEAVYLSPTTFPREVLQALKFREERLAFWRLSGQISGAATFSIFWIVYKFKVNPNFYFRNFCYYALFAGLTAYLFGRFFEFHANVRHYREMLFKMALDYNVNDDEISDLHQKLNEHYLKENQVKSSLDSVKFKL